jgi:hypothetical protein
MKLFLSSAITLNIQDFTAQIISSIEGANSNAFSVESVLIKPNAEVT